MKKKVSDNGPGEAALCTVRQRDRHTKPKVHLELGARIVNGNLSVESLLVVTEIERKLA